jgi:hypothetical protein
MIQLSIGTLTDADLWALKQALAVAQAPSVPAPNPSPAPTPAPVGGRNIAIPLQWGAPGSGNVHVLTENYGGFHDKDVAIVSFKTPANTAPGQVGSISAGEYRSAAISRTASLSLRPGSFDNDLGVKGFLGAVSGATLVSGTTVSVSFQIGGTSLWYPVLQPSTTYYFNIKNTNGVGGDMVIELIKPPGM